MEDLNTTARAEVEQFMKGGESQTAGMVARGSRRSTAGCGGVPSLTSDESG